MSNDSTKYHPRLHVSVQVSDHVQIKTTDLPDMELGGNPFHYDSMLMGTSLSRGWTIMHEGFDSQDGTQFPMRILKLFNARTGQVIKLDLIPRTLRLQEAVVVFEQDTFQHSNKPLCEQRFIADKTDDNNYIHWKDVSNTPLAAARDQYIACTSHPDQTAVDAELMLHVDCFRLGLENVRRCIREYFEDSWTDDRIEALYHNTDVID